MSKAIISSDLFAEYSSPTFVRWHSKTANTPYKAGLTYGQEGFALVFGEISKYHTVITWIKGGNNMWAHYVSEGTDYGWSEYAQKSDLVARSIYVAKNSGTQNFNIGNNGAFLLIPYTSTTYGIYYLGTNSAKLILGTEDSDFKVSISGTTCMLQNNKGWNIFCVFIAGQ